ncbi:MAG: EF-hand domain-containing protein [Brevundimonas sp.]
MDRDKPLKKSETVEIRLPHATKTAFMARCRAEGRTASDAIRRFIDAELSQTSSMRRSTRLAPRLGWRPLLAAAVAGLALGAVAAPSLAQSSPPSRAAFDRMDRNHDGVVSYDEYGAR